MIRFVARTYPPCWVLKARIQKHRGKPLLFHDKCPGFFYVHYTTHGTYSFTFHPKGEAISVKCLAQGHKRRNRPGRDSNPHSGNTRTWVQCTRPLGHNTLLGIRKASSVNVFKSLLKTHLFVKAFYLFIRPGEVFYVCFEAACGDCFKCIINI